MATRTAKASGTIKNTGNVASTYKVSLWTHAADESDVTKLFWAARDSATASLAPGETSATISLSSSYAGMQGGYLMEAYVQLQITAPVAAVLANTTTVTFVEPALTGGTWTGTPTISSLVGPNVEGKFALEITQGGGSGGPLLVTLGGLVGIIAAAFGLRRR